ncbi:hypothetical protein D3C85_1352260 [compost metagenome]
MQPPLVHHRVVACRVGGGVGSLQVQRGMHQRVFSADAAAYGEQGFVGGIAAAECCFCCSADGSRGKSGGIGDDLHHGETPFVMELPPLATKQVGWQLYAGWSAGTKGTRQARMPPAHSCHKTPNPDAKKAPKSSNGRCCAFRETGDQTRSLDLQRQREVNAIKKPGQ